MNKIKMTVSIDEDAAVLLGTLTSERKRGEYLSDLVRQQVGAPTKEALIQMLQAYQSTLMSA
jgi:hypothetical protein